jgi:hypothetical protein
MVEEFPEIHPLETAIQPAAIERDEEHFSASKTLARMKAILEKTYPDKIPLSETSRKRFPKTAMAEAVTKTIDLKVKAKLAKEVVQHFVGTGQYEEAVDFLLVGDLHRASLPEFQNPVWVGRLYDQALEEGKTLQAWRIAERMVDQQTRKTIVKYEPKAEESLETVRERVTTPTGAQTERDVARIGLVQKAVEEHQYRSGWQVREQKAFDAHVEGVIGELERHPESPGIPWGASFVFDLYRQRGEWDSQPDPQALRFARAYCQKLAVNPERMLMALEVAIEANLPQADLDHYVSQLPRGDQIRGRIKSWQARTRRLRRVAETSLAPSPA